MSNWVEQAARVGDPIKHSSILSRYGLSVVALIGGTAAALLAVPTMGGSLALMAATAAATIGADAAGQAIGRAELETDIANRVLEEDTGEEIIDGAASVFVDEEKERAAKADPTTTLDHAGHWVSWGSRTVFIENTYASRFGDHTSCGGHICFGSETVFYGGEKIPYPGVSDNPREQHPLDEEFFAISLAVGLAATARVMLTRRAMTQAAQGAGAPRGATPYPRWDSWDNYPKVTVDGQEYAVIGNRLYSRHAVDRMQPGRYRTASSGTTDRLPRSPIDGTRPAPFIRNVGGHYDYGRGVPPIYVEEVITTTPGVLQPSGNYLHTSGTLSVVVNPRGNVVTVITDYAN